MNQVIPARHCNNAKFNRHSLLFSLLLAYASLTVIQITVCLVIDF